MAGRAGVRRQRRAPRTAVLVVAAVVALGASACNPPRGQGRVGFSGLVTGSASGPSVSCTRSGTTVTATWRGSIGRNVWNVEIRLRRSDGQGQVVASYVDGTTFRGWSSGDVTGITADEDGTLHADHDIAPAQGGRPAFHVRADLRCP